MSVDVTALQEEVATAMPEAVAAPVNHGPAANVLGRTFDIVVAGLALIVLSPLIAGAALAVRFSSPGPILFRQRRLGRDLRPFTVLKFRTMRADSDSAVHRDYVRSLIGGKPVIKEHGRLYKLVVDDRITPAGRILRSWSMDELPQLWNVMRGDMSLVGPRPVIEYEVTEYPTPWLRRFAVKPGLTGLWQVSGRNERTYEEMVRFDVEYAERKSLWLDLKILARTGLVVLRRQGVA